MGSACTTRVRSLYIVFRGSSWSCTFCGSCTYFNLSFSNRFRVWLTFPFRLWCFCGVFYLNVVFYFLFFLKTFTYFRSRGTLTLFANLLRLLL